MLTFSIPLCFHTVPRQYSKTVVRDIGTARSWRSSPIIAHGFNDLDSIASKITFHQDQTIYFDGDPTDHCYRVISGVVRICKETEDGRRQITAFPSAGDLFGWTGNRRHACVAEAASDVILLRWSRQAIETAIVNDADTGHQLLLMLLEQLANMQNHLLLLGRMNASERIATFLLSRADHCECTGMRSRRLRFRICRRDIGDHLGLTVETVSRTMHAFKRRGLIDFVLNQSLEILDRPGLEQIAGGPAD